MKGLATITPPALKHGSVKTITKSSPLETAQCARQAYDNAKMGMTVKPTVIFCRLVRNNFRTVTYHT